MRTLSVRQPWAWLIVNNFKPLENRTWYTGYRGELLIHAAKGMTHYEYEDCEILVENVNRKTGSNIVLPAFGDLERGGIVGSVDLVGCVDHSDSPWFSGDYGFMLENAKTLPFTPYKGQLGFFDVDLSIKEPAL